MTHNIVRYKYEIDLNTDVLLLVYLAQAYRMDLESLILLYDRIGKDIFYVFFLLSGKSVIMPKHTKFVKIRNFVDNVYSFMKKEDCPLFTDDTEDLSNDDEEGDNNNSGRSNNLFTQLQTGEGLTRQEKTFFSFINSVYNKSTNKIVIDCEIPECESL